MAKLQARERLLLAAVKHALDRGIVDLSLREIASAIGTSHRMLIYHFGSREGLLAAVVREVERRERESIGTGPPSVADARRRWDHLADPTMHSQERLFFEIYAHALLGRPGTEGFLEEAVQGWIDPMTKLMADAGVEEADAQVIARLGLAVTRGLLLDLLATGDVAGTTRTFQLFIQMLETASLDARARG